MAVSPEHQRQGFGKTLMTELEADLRSRGIATLTLHARATAVEFYEKLGYTVIGDDFLDVTVAHFRMVKTLPPVPTDPSGPGLHRNPTPRSG